MESRPPDKVRETRRRQSLDLLNLELDRGLMLARFCRRLGNAAGADDVRKAKAAYDRAREAFNRQSDMTGWQRRGLERKLKRLQQCIGEVEAAALAVHFGPRGTVCLPTASALNHKP